MNKATTRIAQYLVEVNEGNPWHGNSITQILENITADQAMQYPISNAHSIWELVLHLNSWRSFVLEKLNGNKAFKIDLNTPIDWPKVKDTSPKAWQATLAKYKSLTQDLKAAIVSFDEEHLEQIVEGHKYNWYFMLQGIIHHDIYHSGQIRMIHNLLKYSKE